jgi:protein MpaA
VKKSLIFLIIFLISSSVNGVLASDQIVITADRLNVRDGVWGKKLGKVYEGQQFEVTEEKEEWAKIEYELGEFGWISLDYARPALQTIAGKNITLTQFCAQVDTEFKKLGWKDISCNSDDWQANWHSEKGQPLIYKVFGNENSTHTTLLMCSVHSDEDTTYHCFRFMELLRSNPELIRQRLVLIPLLNPDGFFSHPRSRTNANGVDLNRNLPTKDWASLAHRQWKWSYQKNPRYNPGKTAGSEKENQFLVSLILQYKPDKIVSLHSPLDFIDLDYMDKREGDKELLAVRKRAWFQAQSFAKQSGTRFRDYRTFPGSLGRFGDEWKIPIYTLEFPEKPGNQAAKEFERFKLAMLELFNTNLSTNPTALNNEQDKDQLL